MKRDTKRVSRLIKYAEPVVRWSQDSGERGAEYNHVQVQSSSNQYQLPTAHIIQPNEALLVTSDEPSKLICS